MKIEPWLESVIKQIESDAAACENEAEEFKRKGDGMNSYLMSTQAMAHRLDIKRIREAASHV